jgi:hypothetical protein
LIAELQICGCGATFLKKLRNCDCGSASFKLRNCDCPPLVFGEVSKVTLINNSDEELSDEFLLKSNGDEALNDVFASKVTAMKRLTLGKKLR